MEEAEQPAPKPPASPEIWKKGEISAANRLIGAGQASRGISSLSGSRGIGANLKWRVP